MTISAFVDELRGLATEALRKEYIRNGGPENVMGLKYTYLQFYKKELGKNQEMALKLWETKIPEIQILATMIADQNQMTGELIEKWNKDVNFYLLSDAFIGNILTPFKGSLSLANKWINENEEYTLRHAYSIIFMLAKESGFVKDTVFERYLISIKNNITEMNNIFKKLKSNYKNSAEVSNKIRTLVNKLAKNSILEKDEFLYIIENITIEETDYLYGKAYESKYFYYQNRVYLRGLIEISNYCKMGCKYCGINNKSEGVERYRLTVEEIIKCCEIGHDLGYNTFVLQSGEDSYYTDKLIIEILGIIKAKFPGVRITLSFGERSKESYKKIFDAGADRYLLRHETASRRLYEHVHPEFMSFDNRRECLKNLKEIGYQVGAGFMVGLPTQNNEDLVEDLLFLKELEPEMIGIGPYLCHENTELKGDIVYDMYKPSEMSILMNDMYDYNLKIKQEILEGKTPANFPTNFLNIYTAELSEFKSRNETFQAYSSLFVENQKEIFKGIYLDLSNIKFSIHEIFQSNFSSKKNVIVIESSKNILLKSKFIIKF